jgi:hypothetical protein
VRARQWSTGVRSADSTCCSEGVAEGGCATGCEAARDLRLDGGRVGGVLWSRAVAAGETVKSRRIKIDRTARFHWVPVYISNNARVCASRVYPFQHVSDHTGQHAVDEAERHGAPLASLCERVAVRLLNALQRSHLCTSPVSTCISG